ncbi:hypothetical protein AAFF_G00271640 [Aldrovandia affinis]|uniref:CTCK domain-containing protein n=1 Tax=Aldrovandia affinis TaxID=143900 RepID=A0AAD7W1J7_9TELE|nr:hypothetical protein AAFF_G00271640 [Aldrovandia affinis]
MQRRAGSSYAMSARDLESLATAVHRPRATGELVNRTRAADSVRSARPAAQRKFSASRSQAQHFLLNGLRPTPLVDIWSPTDSPPLKNAKKFWNHFMFRRRSGFQSILPIGNNEVHQQKCHAIPFSQSVAHRGCETLVLKNHLCVGRCSAAVRVPADVRGEEGRRHALCSHCAPVTFRLRKVPLRCAGDAHVIKVVAMVEDCQCEGQRGRHAHPHSGPGLIGPSLSRNQALQPEKRRRGPASPMPPEPVRQDNISHWPVMAAVKGRCKYPGCEDGMARMMFTKRGLYLCITMERNCFLEFASSEVQQANCQETSEEQWIGGAI